MKELKQDVEIGAESCQQCDCPSPCQEWMGGDFYPHFTFPPATLLGNYNPDCWTMLKLYSDPVHLIHVTKLQRGLSSKDYKEGIQGVY